MFKKLKKNQMVLDQLLFIAGKLKILLTLMEVFRNHLINGRLYCVVLVLALAEPAYLLA